MKNVFFDLDGTLSDPFEGITNSVIYALKKFGIDENDNKKLSTFIGPPLVDSFMKYYGFNREKGLLGVKYYREYYAPHGIYESTIYDGIPEMLENLKKNGKRIILATSKPEKFAKMILERFDILKYFDFVCGAEMDERGRCKKDDVIKYALEKSASEPCESVMVGDRDLDILGGKKFGMKTVGVLYGYGTNEELKLAKADFIADSVSSLSEILN